ELRAVYASGYLVCPRDEVPESNAFDKGCAGKGRSRDQAKASALCEALERVSGVYQGDEPRIRATRNELGSQALNLEDLLNFSEAQYGAREEQSEQGTDPRQSAPERCHSEAVIDWVPGWSVSRKDRRYVPLAYCYAEAPVESGTSFCRPSGNG